MNSIIHQGCSFLSFLPFSSSCMSFTFKFTSRSQYGHCSSRHYICIPGRKERKMSPLYLNLLPRSLPLLLTSKELPHKSYLTASVYLSLVSWGIWPLYPQGSLGNMFLPEFTAVLNKIRGLRG